MNSNFTSYPKLIDLQLVDIAVGLILLSFFLSTANAQVLVNWSLSLSKSVRNTAIQKYLIQGIMDYYILYLYLLHHRKKLLLIVL